MPNYSFRCAGCEAEFDHSCPVDERDLPIKSPCCYSTAAYRVFEPTTAISIPPYMRAPGSKESSAESCDRQAAYLNSDAWRQERKKIDEKGGSVRLGADCNG